MGLVKRKKSFREDPKTTKAIIMLGRSGLGKRTDQSDQNKNKINKIIKQRRKKEKRKQ